MADETPSEFKFNADDQDPETFYQEEIKDLRVEKLSQRITLLTILLPILIGIAIFFIYRDLAGRVNRTHDTGSMEVQRISRQLEEVSKEFNDKLITFSTTLSSQDKQFGTNVTEKIAAVNKNVADLNKNLKSLNENLDRTQSTVKNLAGSKADKKSQDAAFSKVNRSLDSLEKQIQTLAKLQTELETVSAGIQKLENDLNQKIAVVTVAAEQSKQDYSQLQTSLSGLSDKMVDKDTFELEIFKLRKNYQNRVAQEITEINQRLAGMQKKIDSIQRDYKSQKRSMKSMSKKPSTATAAGTDATTPARSEAIDEQDLPE